MVETWETLVRLRTEMEECEQQIVTLREALAQEIHRLIAEGATVPEVARRTGYSKPYIKLLRHKYPPQQEEDA